MRDTCFATADADVLPHAFSRIESRVLLESETDSWTRSSFLMEQVETMLLLDRFEILRTIRTCRGWSAVLAGASGLTFSGAFSATSTFATT